MKLAKYVLLALLATLSVAVLAGCETGDDEWVEERCVELETCNSDNFDDLFSSLADCIERLGLEYKRARSVGGDCPAAFRGLAECDFRSFCVEGVDCKAASDAERDACRDEVDD